MLSLHYEFVFFRSTTVSFFLIMTINASFDSTAWFYCHELQCTEIIEGIWDMAAAVLDSKGRKRRFLESGDLWQWAQRAEL